MCVYASNYRHHRNATVFAVRSFLWPAQMWSRRINIWTNSTRCSTIKWSRPHIPRNTNWRKHTGIYLWCRLGAAIEWAHWSCPIWGNCAFVCFVKWCQVPSWQLATLVAESWWLSLSMGALSITFLLSSQRFNPIEKKIQIANASNDSNVCS